METEESRLASSSIVSQAIREGVLIDNNGSFTCLVCNITMTGIVPAMFHLQGTKHKKAVQTNKMEPDVKAAIQSGIVMTSELGNQMVFMCVPCNKTFSGEMPLMQHLVSKVHAKKLRQKSLSSNTSPEKTIVPVTSPSTCPPVRHNSPLPVELSSSVQDVEVAIRNGIVQSKEVVNMKVLICVPCNKPCSGDVPMMQHLMSEAHNKKLRQGIHNYSFSPQEEASITPTSSSSHYGLTSSPDISRVMSNNSSTQYGLSSPPDMLPSQDDAVNEAMKDGIIKVAEHDASHLYCVVCKVSCTGGDSMNQHLQGKNHLKTLKLMHQTSRQSLGSSPASSPSHSIQQPPVEHKAVKKEVHEVNVHETTNSSYTQQTEHHQGSLNRIQYWLRQSHTMEYETVPSTESGTSSPSSTPSLSSTTDCSDIVPPPPQFKDSSHPSSPVTWKIKSNGNGNSCMTECISSTKVPKNESKKKQISKKLLKLLPDVKVYTCKDSLANWYED